MIFYALREYCINCGSIMKSESYLTNFQSKGPVCYNPNTHTCADNRKLCGKNDGVCGNQCYNRKTHRCLTSAHGCKLCSVYDSLCGTTCYNPNLYR